MHIYIYMYIYQDQVISSSAPSSVNLENRMNIDVQKTTVQLIFLIEKKEIYVSKSRFDL